MRIPVDPANDFVITPLQTQQQPPAVTTALPRGTLPRPSSEPRGRPPSTTPAGHRRRRRPVHPEQVATGDYGPVPVLATGSGAMAATGALDGALLRPAAASTRLTTPSRSCSWGTVLPGRRRDRPEPAGQPLGDDERDVGATPGQPWLGRPRSGTRSRFNPAEDATTTTVLQDNADAWIFGIIGVLGIVLVLVPFIPGLRSVPRWVPLHRVIWRSYHRRYGDAHLE